ncbi:MAG: hypothetical protein ACYDH1_03340 [Anaerolineaceae bacterium]|jgi:hypothetical protein|nr:MAG: hypothetical protein CVU46_08790 [Chloroflexi bacterium HGW-Chloroflexi-8]
MTNKALFEGLVVDEYDRSIGTTYVGQDPCYVIDDNGFKNHILSEIIDRQVLDQLLKSMEGHEEIISQQAAKMLGQEDLFTNAIILNQLKQMDKQFEQLLQTGIPNETRAYLGLMGFKVVVNIHGDVLEVKQPGIIEDPGEE